MRLDLLFVGHEDVKFARADSFRDRPIRHEHLIERWPEPAVQDVALVEDLRTGKYGAAFSRGVPLGQVSCHGLDVFQAKIVE